MFVAIVLLCSAVVLGCAVLCFSYEKRMIRRAVRTKGRIKGISPVGGGGQPVPLVEFADETGEQVCRAAQRLGARGVKAGQEVDVLYTHKKVLGIDAWNVFLVREGRSPFVIYRLAGFLLLALGVGFAAAAMLIA